MLHGEGVQPWGWVQMVMAYAAWGGGADHAYAAWGGGADHDVMAYAAWGGCADHDVMAYAAWGGGADHCHGLCCMMSWLQTMMSWLICCMGHMTRGLWCRP